MNRQSQWLSSVTSGLIAKPDPDPIGQSWLREAVDRVVDALRGGNPDALRCAENAFWELRAEMLLQQGERSA